MIFAHQELEVEKH